MPAFDFGKQQLGIALIANEVVVHKEDRSSPAEVVQTLKLGYQLVRRFGAGLAAVKNDDVAELAVEGAAPGKLNAHGVISVEFEQIEAGDGGGRHIRFFTF